MEKHFFQKVGSYYHLLATYVADVIVNLHDQKLRCGTYVKCLMYADDFVLMSEYG